MKKLLLKFVALLGLFLFLGSGSAWAVDAPNFLYVRTADNSWNSTRGILVNKGKNSSNSSEYIFEGTIAYLNGNFKITQSLDNWNGVNLGANVTINSDYATEVYQGRSDNLSCSELKNIHFTLYFKTSNGDGYLVVSEEKNKTYPSKLYLMGNVDGMAWEPSEGVEVSGNGGIYTWENIKVTSGNTFCISGSIGNDWNTNVNNNDRYGANIKDKTISIGTTDYSVCFNSPYASRECFSWKINETGYVDITLNLNDLKVSVTKSYPKELYLFGHINNQAWETYNYITLTNEGNGKYSAKGVNISGIWNEADEQFDSKHKKGEHTDGENYIAFFTEKINDRTNFGSHSSKLGAVKENQEVNKDEETNKIQYSSYNFMVADGYYDIEVDLVAGTIKFKRYGDRTNDGKYIISYDWHDGEGKKMEYSDQDVLEFIQGKDNIVQVGVNGADDHWAATSATFTVYKNSRANVKGKRLANEGDFSTKAELGIDYNLLGDNNESVDTHNSNVNNKIHLLSAGDYMIVAELPEGSKASSYYSVEPVTMYASVTAVQASAGDPVKDFNSLSNSYTFEEAFALNTDKVSDIKVSIQPNSDVSATSDWIKNPAETLSAGYEEILPENLYSQYRRLNASIVDGFYKEVDNILISASEDADNNGYYEYTLNANFYCSGVYKITIEPAENATTSFDPVQGTITIRPNLLTSYGTGANADQGFNINGYTFTTNNGTNTIELPQNDVNEIRGVGYIPGIYFASSFTTNHLYSGQANLNKRNEKSDAPYFTLIDLQSLTDLTVDVIKNGAKGTAVFSISIGNGKPSTTGIEGITSEEGEAVYYNLQGVRVENPEHGIFVKVVNGKATKVVK